MIVSAPLSTSTAPDADASERGPDPGMFLLSRTGNTSKALTVRLKYGGTAHNGVDYRALPTRVTIPPGASSLTLRLTPIPDSRNEPTETVVISLQTMSAYDFDPGMKASIFIQNSSARTASIGATDAMASVTGSNPGRHVLSLPATPPAR